MRLGEERRLATVIRRAGKTESNLGDGSAYDLRRKKVSAPAGESTYTFHETLMTYSKREGCLYHFQDANWNVVSTLNSALSETERVVYDPYGLPSFYAGNWTSPTGADFLFQGRWYYPLQTASGDKLRLYHFRNRTCVRTLGTFLQRDLPQYSYNTYNFEGLSPLRSRDPSGHYTIAKCAIEIGWGHDTDSERSLSDVKLWLKKAEIKKHIGILCSRKIALGCKPTQPTAGQGGVCVDDPFWRKLAAGNIGVGEKATNAGYSAPGDTPEAKAYGFYSMLLEVLDLAQFEAKHKLCRPNSPCCCDRVEIYFRCLRSSRKAKPELVQRGRSFGDARKSENPGTQDATAHLTKRFEMAENFRVETLGEVPGPDPASLKNQEVLPGINVPFWCDMKQTFDCKTSAVRTAGWNGG